MTLTLNSRSDLVEPAARLLASAIDLGDGGTAEQRRILELVVHNIWHRPDIDVEYDLVRDDVSFGLAVEHIRRERRVGAGVDMAGLTRRQRFEQVHLAC